MKAALLRQSILQAAVQGKLVPQNPHDESAMELLKRIQQEKVRLIKEGKIKEEKPLPLITEDDVPYDLPDGWVWCRLGDIVTLYNGRAYKKHELLDKGTYPVLRVGNLFTNSQWYYSTLELSDDKYCDTGDLLYAWSASFGPYIWQGEKVIYHYHIWKLSLHFPAMRDFIFYVLQAQTEMIKNSGHGLAMIHVTKENTEIGLFPLPPLSEQLRIITKIEELMALCDQLEAVEKELDNLETNFAAYLPKSILQAAVQGKLVPQNPHDEPASELLKHIELKKKRLTKECKNRKGGSLPAITKDEIPYDLPEGWTWCRLGELCDYGSAANAEPVIISDDSWILELEDIKKDTGLLCGKIKKRNRNSQSTKHIFAEGNVLYSKLRPYLNKVIVADQDGYCTSEILPLDFGMINPFYAMWFLRSPFFVDYANKRSYGVKMPRLGTEDGRMALFALPPLAEQQRIVSKVDELLALCEELKEAREFSNLQVPSNVVQFPLIDEREDLLMSAHGDASQGLSDKAQRDADELLGD